MSKRSKPTMAPRKPLPLPRPAPRLAPSQVAALEAEAGGSTAPSTAGSSSAPRTSPEAKPTRAQVRDTPRRRADLTGSDRPPPERVTVHLEADLAQALRMEAGRRRWSLSYAVGEAVRAYLDGLEQ